MKKIAIALTSAALAAFVLTGCSTTPPADNTNETQPTSKPADPNAPRGYVVTASSTPSQTETGDILAIGAGNGFDFIHSSAEPKLFLTSQEGKYTCQVADHMSLADAKTFVNGELSEGKDDFLKEATGEAFAVKLLDKTAQGEAHRFISPATGTGLLVSCFGDQGAPMAEKAWEWIAGNVEVAVVTAAEEGKIASPSGK